MRSTGVGPKDIRAHFKLGAKAYARILQSIEVEHGVIKPPRNTPDHNLIEQKFNNLTITGFTYDQKYKIWKMVVRCDCGVVGTAKLFQLENGQRKTCGIRGCAYFHNIRRTNGRSGNFTGCEDIYGSRWGGWRCGAAARNLEFSVTPEYGWALFVKQNKLCALSGVEIAFGTAWNKVCTASLDRIDSTQGYIDGNVQWVHKAINLMKRDMTDAEFLDWCKRIVLHSGA